ncbi:MAG: FG-GAP repeat protein [candidate division BRC1 bacterium ADurb.BinA292]|nr:MAG: FG-GAP repeat protein [candidate division BRC1 bacterium ADurb.BinA292]
MDITRIFRASRLWLAAFGILMSSPLGAVEANPPGTPAPSRPELWRYRLDNPAIDTLMVDIDGDGFRDLLTLDQGKLYLREEGGYPLWHERNAELDAVRLTRILTVCNLDAAGATEIVAESDADLWLIDAATMRTLARLPETALLGLTDLNEDGAAEIYTAPRQSDDPEFPPVEVSSLADGRLTSLWSHPGCQLMRKPTQDAYQPGESNERFYILDLNDDGAARDLLVALPGGGGWIGLGFNQADQFEQIWQFTDIQDGTSRLRFMDWTDGNYDTYYDVLAYQYDTRRVFNADVVSLGDSIGSFPLRHIDEPRSSAEALKIDRVKPGEWPMRHRDPRWTARSPLKLGMTEAPAEAWNYPLGGSPTGLSLADLDGRDGPDLLVAARGRLSAWSGEGQPLWHSDYLGAPELRGFYDLDGDGRDEMLVYYRHVHSRPTYAALDPATGRELWKFETKPYVASQEMVLTIGKFLPGSKGLQAFSLGPFGFGADLTFFDFSNGLTAAAEPVWRSTVEHVIYPTHDIYDFDSDGDFDFILLEHSRLRIFDLATGRILRDFTWGDYRSYGKMLPIKFENDPVFKLLILSDNSMMNVEMVDINATSGSLMWKVTGKVGFRLTDPAEGIKLKSELERIGDVDGDGRVDVVYLKYNESGDKRWHGYVRDIVTGEIKQDIPLQSDSFEEAGLKAFAQLPEQPARPEPVQATPPPAGSVRVVDPGAGAVEILDAAGQRLTALQIPESVSASNWYLQVADLEGDGTPEIIVPRLPDHAAPSTRRPLILTANERIYDTERLILHAPAQSATTAALLRTERGRNLLIFDYDQDGRNDRLDLEPHPEGARLVLTRADGETVWSNVIPSDIEIFQQVTFGEFNGDGYLDVFLNFAASLINPEVDQRVFTLNGEIVRRCVWDGRTGGLLWHACNVINERPFDYANHPIVYDVNGDGIDDIVSMAPDILAVCSGDSGKLIYDPRYTKSFWRQAGSLYNVPFVEDLDGDGFVEVYGQRAVGGICVMRLPNEPMWVNDLGDQGLYGKVADVEFQGVADVDGDGRMEIGFGLRMGEFRCYAAEDGHLQWSVPVNSPTTEICSADVDGDGRFEFLFGAEDGALYAVRGGDGEAQPVLWKVDLGAPVGPPIVADADGDGQGEILVTTADGFLRCLKAR